MILKKYNCWYYVFLYDYCTNILVIYQVENLLTAAWNTLAFTKFWKVRISKVRLHDLCLFLQHCSHDVDDVIIEGCQYYLIVTILD